MISEDIPTDNISTLSARHAQRDDQSQIGHEKAEATADEQRYVDLDKSFRPRPPTPPLPRSFEEELSEDSMHPRRSYPSFNAGSAVSVPKYDLQNISRWAELYEFISKANGWDETTKFNRLFQAFEGTPHLDYFLRLMRTRQINSWPTARAVFLRRFAEKD